MASWELIKTLPSKPRQLKLKIDKSTVSTYSQVVFYIHFDTESAFCESNPLWVNQRTSEWLLSICQHIHPCLVCVDYQNTVLSQCLLKQLFWNKIQLSDYNTLFQRTKKLQTYIRSRPCRSYLSGWKWLGLRPKPSKMWKLLKPEIVRFPEILKCWNNQNGDHRLRHDLLLESSLFLCFCPLPFNIFYTKSIIERKHYKIPT